MASEEPLPVGDDTQVWKDVARLSQEALDDLEKVERILRLCPSVLRGKT